jgi:class 3 adenylate cyclase
MRAESSLEELFQQRLGKWRATASDYYCGVRTVTILVWLAVIGLFGSGSGRAFPVDWLGAYGAVALALWVAGRHWPRLHRHVGLSILLLDIPVIFAMESHAIASPLHRNPIVQAVAALGVFMIVLVVVVLLDGSRRVVASATILAITCQILIMRQAGVPLFGTLTNSIIQLGTAALLATCFHRQMRSVLLDVSREQLSRNRLGRYFPPEVVRRVIDSKDGGALETSEVEVVAVFVDISNFTELSAVRQPREVMALLNEYFPVMAEIVFRHGGTLEKYIGDALLAVWGAPFPTPDDADRALQAAAEMQQAMVGLNARWRAEGRPELQLHVGLNTGRVAAGNLGSEHYLQYATIGDTTNVASRICGVAHCGEIVISESTFQRWRDRRWRVEKLPPTKVKGKSEELTLYRVDWRKAATGEVAALALAG